MYKEPAGIFTIHTLVDNYCEVYEIYTCKTDTGTIEFVDRGTCRDKVSIETGYIILTPKSLTLWALPDFAIDVLQTTGTAIGRETLCRVAKVYGDKFVGAAAQLKCGPIYLNYNEDDEKHTNALMEADE